MTQEKKQQATEQLSYEDGLKRLPESVAYAETVLARLHHVRPIAKDNAIVDIGAAQGRFVIACVQRGFRAVGVEPWAQAREMAMQIARHVGVEIDMREGTAENLPLPSEQFDIVHASSVIEHVQDARAAFAEAYRVLKPGGIFWFSTASSVCPWQGEIRGFPCFGWYPIRLKRRIMAWAKAHKPHLIGHTDTPAIHWFSPWKARRMLREVGFRKVYDRWDLRLPSEGGRLYGAALRCVRLCGLTKLLADMAISSCAYAAVK